MKRENVDFEYMNELVLGCPNNCLGELGIYVHNQFGTIHTYRIGKPALSVTHYNKYYIECEYCSRRSGYHHEPKGAILDWNQGTEGYVPIEDIILKMRGCKRPHEESRISETVDQGSVSL